MRSGLVSSRRRLSSDSSGCAPRKIADQRLAVGGAALRVAERIELQHDAIGDAERLENPLPERDDLDVGLRLATPSSSTPIWWNWRKRPFCGRS